MKSISPQELSDLHYGGSTIELIDVRTPIEFEESHIAFAKNIPLAELQEKKWATSRTDGNNEPVYFICATGSRGETACLLFEKAGFPNVYNVEGGMSSCRDGTLPFVRNRSIISLERQVRIAAGTLVLTGLLLSFVSPAFLLLSVFVGGGLIYSGITDTCGMGIVLSRMPWNRVGSPKCEAPSCALR